MIALCILGSCVRSTPKSNVASATKSVSAADIVKLSGEPSGSGRCGAYSVQWRSPAAEGGPLASLEVRRGGRRVLEIRAREEFEQILGRWCGDVTGDGRPELGHEVFTGGAHCCFAVRVDTLEGPTLLDVDLGNADSKAPQQLDGKGALEIDSANVMDGFGGLSYAASPWLPRTFAFKGGRYVDAATQFPAHIRANLRTALRELEQVNREEAGVDGMRGLALGVFGHYVLLDEEQAGLAEVTARVPEDIAYWIEQNAADAVSWIRHEATSAGT